MTEVPGSRMSVGRVVLLTDIVGLGAVGAVLWLAAASPSPQPPALPTTPATMLGLVALTIVGQLAYVKVPHGQTNEELTFFEVVFAAGILLIAPGPLVAATLAGVLISEWIVRRPAIKVAFNLGMLAASTSSMILTYRLLSGTAEMLTLRSVIALMLASLVFAAVDLMIMANLLHSTSGIPPQQLVGEEWRLSAFMAIGSAGVGMVGVALALSAPPLLPFTFLPALALWYAYGAAAQHAEARERNRWLITLGGALARHGQGANVLGEAAEAIAKVFGAPELRVVSPIEPDRQHTPAELELLASIDSDPGPRELQSGELPEGWHNGKVTRLDVGSAESGALLLGSAEEFGKGLIPGQERGWQLDEADAPVLGALVAALGSSLRAGATFDALAEETAKLTAVVDNTSDGIAMVDETGRVRLWSQTMARMTSVDEATLQALPSVDAMPEVVRTLLQAAWSAEHVVEGGPRTVHVHLVRPDEEELDVIVSTVRVLESATTAASETANWVSILTVHDETRERRVEKMKTDFVATISHELRTPITPIKGYAHLLATRGDRIPAEKRKAALQTISDRADHLARLVDDLLLASRVSEGARLAVEMGVEDLAEVIAQAVATFPAMSGRIRLDLPSEPIAIQCDRVRAVQCLSNLIGNAEKYTPPGSPIDIWVDATPMQVRIHVRDHGPGIPQAEQARVFERFYRIEDPFTMKTGGAGLGLHIARELAIAMGGGLTLESPEGGQGAQFVLHLLTTAAPAAGSGSRIPEPHSAPGEHSPAGNSANLEPAATAPAAASTTSA